MRQHHGAKRYRALAPVAREAARPSVTVATSTAVTRQLLPSRPLPCPRPTEAVSAMDRDEVVARIAPLLHQALTALPPATGGSGRGRTRETRK